MDVIELRGLLPDVFDAERSTERVSRSEIWLHDVTLSRPGCCRIEASSGTGKSSLCSFLYGNRTDYSGKILFDGEDVRHFSVDRWCEIRKNHIAYLPQDMKLFPELSAIENIQLKNRLTDVLSGNDIARMLERLELDGMSDRKAGRLSIGQQQRVAVIRALSQPFDFLLLDEPVSHLDDKNNSAVAGLVKEIAERNHAAVIVTSVGNHLKINANKIYRL